MLSICVLRWILFVGIISFNPAGAPAANGRMVPILRFGNFHVGLEQSETGFGEHSAS